jgi:hypothetical protein
MPASYRDLPHCTATGYSAPEEDRIRTLPDMCGNWSTLVFASSLGFKKSVRMKAATIDRLFQNESCLDICQNGHDAMHAIT